MTHRCDTVGVVVTVCVVTVCALTIDVTVGIVMVCDMVGVVTCDTVGIVVTQSKPLSDKQQRV